MDRVTDPNAADYSIAQGCSLLCSGKLFPIFDPKPDDIQFEDIAHSLARQCRWAGHTREFYSVAQHCVLVASHLPEHLQLTGLLHDASEAYLSDVIRPIKYSDIMPGYVPLEEKIQRVIAQKYNLVFPMPDEIKLMDNRVLIAELRDLFPATLPEGFFPTEIDPIYRKIVPWSSGIAEAAFRDAFIEYSCRNL